MKNEIYLLNLDMFENLRKYSTPFLVLTALLMLGCSSSTGPSIPDFRFGDINNNGVAYEVADAVLLSNYFVYGPGVFIIDRDIQIASSDVNQDGKTLTVADLTYLIRNALDEENIDPDPTPVEAIYRVESSGHISIDTRVGAAALQFKGNVEPRLSASNMDMEYAFDANNNITRVLVYSFEDSSTFKGTFLYMSGAELLSIQLGTYEGASVIAKEFEVAQEISRFMSHTFTLSGETIVYFTVPFASEIKFEITDELGNLIFDFNQYYLAGSHYFIWGGTDNYSLAVPNGKYYCTVFFDGIQKTIELQLARPGDDEEREKNSFIPTPLPGDVNLNKIANEVADVVLFTNYFIYGMGVFTINLHGQIAATDVNGDGLTLTVADLTYMIRTVIGDAQPIFTLNPVDAFYNINVNGTIEVDIEMGAAALQLQGNVEPTLLADNMDMEYAFDAANNVTRVLIYNMENGETFTGDFVNTSGADIVSLEMATYEGQTVVLKEISTSFYLYRNYPNPFSDSTLIRFKLNQAAGVRFEISNDAGQVVYDFNQYYQRGYDSFTWRGTDNYRLVVPDGKYICSMIVGDDKKSIVIQKGY